MEKVEYPKWKYHKTKEAELVFDEKQEKALGKGWAESPAEFEENKKEEKVKELGDS